MWSEASGDILVKMREELNEDPQRMQNHVRLLAEWIACKPYMPKNYDKGLLPTFLRFSKQDLQVAKKKVEAFFALVTYNKVVFNNIPMTLEDYIADFTSLLYDSNYLIDQLTVWLNVAIYISTIYVAPKLTPDGCRLTLLTIKASAAKDGFSSNFYKLFYFTEYLKMILGPSRLADDYVMDVSNLTASIVPRMTNIGMLQLVGHFQNTYPVRYRRITYTNMNAFLDQFINLCKPVFGRKIRDRMIYRSHHDITDLYPRAMLPQDFGGDLAPMSVISEVYLKTMRANADRIAAVEQCKLTGAIPEEYKCRFDGGFGIDGSFRKLDLD